MKNLEFAVKNMSIERAASDKAKLISGSVGYFGFHFEFDEEFSALEGQKSVEFFKNRTKKRVDLVENACLVPNEFLQDKTQIEFRVLSGNSIGTTWTSVGVTEGGAIETGEPEEEKPVGLEYVKTPGVEGTIAQIRKGKAGLEYTTNGEEWEIATGGSEESVGGISDVPKTPKNKRYFRAHSDWVALEDKTAAKLKSTETDTATIVAKINELISVLEAQGLVSVIEAGEETGANKIAIMSQNDKITSYGGKSVSDLFKDDVDIEWKGTSGTVTGTFKKVDNWSELPKGTKSGHFFAMNIDGRYLGKQFTFHINGEEKSSTNNATEDELFWVLRIDDNKKFKFTSNGETIAELDFEKANLLDS